MKKKIVIAFFFVIGTFSISTLANAAITLQGPIIDGVYAPFVSAGGGSILPLAQFMLNQNSGSDKLTKVGFYLIGDQDGLTASEISRVSLWKESGTNPGFQIDEDTFVSGAVATSFSVGAGNLITLTPTGGADIGNNTQFYIVATTTSNSGITNGHAFHITADANYASTTAGGLGLSFVSSKVIRLSKTALVKISEVKVGTATNSADEFVELYNSGEVPIDLSQTPISLHTFYSNGSSTPVGITYFKKVIPPQGFFLIASQNGFNGGSIQPDAVFATSSFDVIKVNGGVSIATTSSSLGVNTATSTSVDYIGWGSQPAGNCEGGTCATALISDGKSLERYASTTSNSTKMAVGGEDSMKGNGWDSGDNSANFYLRTIPDPQNSLSTKEFAFSGGGGGGDMGSNALRVMGSYPGPGMTNVPVDLKYIGFGFNKPVDPTTVTASTVTFKKVENGTAIGSNLCITVTYNQMAGNMEPPAKCNLAASLLPSTSYVFMVTSGVTDLGGAGASALDQDSFTAGNQNYYATSTTGAAGQTFTSTIPPTIIGTSPFPGSINVPKNLAKISIEFNQMDMDTSTFTASNITLVGGSSISLSNFSFSTSTGKNILSITPATLSANTTYTLTVGVGVKNRTGSGIPLPSAYTSRFTTGSSAGDTTAPALVGIFPTPGTTISAPTNDFMFTFDDALDPSTVTTSSVTLATVSGGINLPGSVRYDPVSKEGHFTPSNVLPVGQSIRLTLIGATIANVAGVLLGTDITKDWTIESSNTDTTPSSIMFANGNEFELAITFNEAVNSTDATNISNYALTAGGSPQTLSALSGQSLTYDSSTKTAKLTGLRLAPGPFTATTTNIKDLSGNTMTSSVFRGNIMSAGSGSMGGMGFVGPGSFSGSTFGEQRDFSASGIGFMPPVQIRPSSSAVNASSTYTFELPIATQIPAGGTIVITFPSTSDFGLCCAATTSSRNTFVATQNRDINGPGPGTVGISSIVKDSTTKTVTITLDTATRSELFNGNTDTHDFLKFSIADIVNPSIPKGPDSSGYSLDIKSKSSNGTLLESFNANPIYIGGGNAGGGATTTIRGTVTDSTDGQTLGGVTIHLMSPQTGAVDTTTVEADGTYSFTNLAVGMNSTAGAYGGGAGSEFFISTDPSVAPTKKNNGATSNVYFGEPMPTPIRATSTNAIIKNFSLLETSANALTFLVKVGADSSTFTATEQVDVFAGGPGKFMVQTVTPGAGTISSGSTFATLYIPKINGQWGIGIGPAMPKGGGGMMGPPPSTDWASPKPVSLMISGCPTACNATVNGASASSYTFTISKANKTIAGILQDASGNAISGAEVYAYSPTGGTGNRSQTSASGSFSIKVTEGSYSVGAFSPGMGQSKEVSVVMASDGQYYVNGSATAASATTFILKMTKPGYTITGKITDGTNPVSASVFAYRTDSPGGVNAMSDLSTGNYTLYVDNGTWKVNSFIPGFGPMTEQTVTVSSANQTGIDFAPSTGNTMTILSGKIYEDIDGSNGYNTGDTAISGAVVRLSGTGGKMNEGVSDSDGNYSIRVIGSSYNISDIFHPTYNRIAPIGDNGTAIGSIDLSTASTTKNIKVPPRKTVNIFVKDSSGSALTVSKAFIDLFDSAKNAGIHTEITNASTTILQVPNGITPNVRVYIQGVPQSNVSIAGLNGSTVVTNGTFTVDGTENIVVTVNTTANAMSTIIGRVTASGDAVGESWISFIDTTNDVHVGTQATSTGWYNITLANGTYQVMANKPGYVGTPVSITVSGSATQNLTLTQSNLTISGTVTAGGSAAKDSFVRAEKVGGGHAIAKTDTSGAYTINVTSGKWRIFAAAEGYAEGKWSSGINDLVDTTSSSQTGINITLSTTASIQSKLATSNTFTDTSASTFSDSTVGVSVQLDGNTLGTAGDTSYLTAKETTNIPQTDSVNIIGNKAKDISAYSGDSQVKNLQSGKTATVELSYTKAELTAESMTSTSTINNLKVYSYSDDKQEWESLSTVPTYKDTDGNAIATADIATSLSNVASVSFSAVGTHFSAYALADPRGVEPPGTPTGVSATGGSAGSGQITMAWTASSGGTSATGYYIYRDTSASGSFALLANAGNVTSYTDTTPTAGTTYYYKVGAYASGGDLESAASSVANASVAAATSVSSGGRIRIPVITPIVTTSVQTTIPSLTIPEKALLTSIKRDLGKGMNGDDIRALQTILSKDKSIYPEGLVTGYFGPATERAVKRFQAKYGISQVGRVGPQTRAKLQEVSKITGTAQPKIPTPTTPVITPTTSVIFTKLLSKGVSGDDVISLQKILNKDSETRISETGVGSLGNETNYFGSLTERAIQKFQVKYGIAKEGDGGYGLVGPKTRAKLNEFVK